MLKALDTLASIGALIFLIFVITAWKPSARQIEAEAIRRGYALHCPHTGDFAWKGECDE